MLSDEIYANSKFGLVFVPLSCGGWFTLVIMS